MAQIDQGEVRKSEALGHRESEGARVKIERFRFVENADHRVNRLCHSVQFLRRGETLGRGKRSEVVAGCFTAEQKRPCVRPPGSDSGLRRTAGVLGRIRGSRLQSSYPAAPPLALMSPRRFLPSIPRFFDPNG